MLATMSTKPLSTTSYVVLGLLERCQPATVYDLKQTATISVFNFWALPHTVLYTETERLAASGLLAQHQEKSGRRRRTYEITEEGKAALESWRAEPTGDLFEVRDQAILKLFCGGEPQRLAKAQLAAHQSKLDEYLALREELVNDRQPHGMRLALDAGITIERALIDYWTALAEGREPVTDADT